MGRVGCWRMCVLYSHIYVALNDPERCNSCQVERLSEQLEVESYFEAVEKDILDKQHLLEHTTETITGMDFDI